MSDVIQRRANSLSFLRSKELALADKMIRIHLEQGLANRIDYFPMSRQH